MDFLYEASEFVRKVQRAQGLTISMLEKIAFENGWIKGDRLFEAAKCYGKSPYGLHLRDVASAGSSVGRGIRVFNGVPIEVPIETCLGLD